MRKSKFSKKWKQIGLMFQKPRKDRTRRELDLTYGGLCRASSKMGMDHVQRLYLGRIFQRCTGDIWFPTCCNSKIAGRVLIRSDNYRSMIATLMSEFTVQDIQELTT